jgi:hypothetical protein
LLESIVGTQTYVSEFATSGNGARWQVWTPDGADRIQRGFRRCEKPLLGAITPETPITSGSLSFWSLLEHYKNPAINELYTALKVNYQGNVVPTLVFRQIPFSTTVSRARVGTDISTASGVKFKFPPVSCFHDMPRWKLPPMLIKGGNIGFSDAMRINYLEVFGQPVQGDQNTDPSVQRLRNPPLIDDLDIARSGLHHWTMTVNCAPTDAMLGVPHFTHLCADFIMGQHLTLTGSVQSKGIYAPIAEGDNIEIDNIVFHIEQITDAFVFSGGRNHFYTELSLSNGMLSESHPKYDQEAAKTVPQYPLVQDLMNFLEGGLSVSPAEDEPTVRSASPEKKTK